MIGMINLAAGLSEMGKGVAQWAHDTGLEQMKTDLERQSQLLSDQLIRSRQEEEFNRQHSQAAIDYDVKHTTAVNRATSLLKQDPDVLAADAAAEANRIRTTALTGSDPDVLAAKAAATGAETSARVAAENTPEAKQFAIDKAAAVAAAEASARQRIEYSPAGISGAAKKTAAETAARITEETIASLGPGTTIDDVAQPHIENIMAGVYNINNIPDNPKGLRNAVGKGISDIRNADPNKLTPKVAEQLSRVSKLITAPYTSASQYKLALDGLPYLERIKAGLEIGGSTGDEEALDGLIKLANSGNAVTEAQIKLITGSGSYSDFVNVLTNRFSKGGSLSDDQRAKVKRIADATYDAYEKGVQPLYEEATDKLKAQNIPQSLWSIADVKTLSQKVRAALDAAPSTTTPPVTGSGIPVTGGPLPTGPHGEAIRTDGKGKYMYYDIVTKKWTEYQL